MTRVLVVTAFVVIAAIDAACGSLLTASGDDSPSAPAPDVASDAGAATAEGGSVGAGGDAAVPREFRVFITSRQFTMEEIAQSLDGLCQSQLPPAFPGAKFVPWLSTSTRSARDAIEGEGPWRTLTGEVVAANRAALFSGTLENPINVDELGVRLVGATSVWTGTTPAGDVAENCNDWQSPKQHVLTGSDVHTDSGWTALSSEPTCENGTTRVYCFESE